jgi:hypothetical protein
MKTEEDRKKLEKFNGKYDRVSQLFQYIESQLKDIGVNLKPSNQNTKISDFSVEVVVPDLELQRTSGVIKKMLFGISNEDELIAVQTFKDVLIEFKNLLLDKNIKLVFCKSKQNDVEDTISLFQNDTNEFIQNIMISGIFGSEDEKYIEPFNFQHIELNTSLIDKIK